MIPNILFEEFQDYIRYNILDSISPEHDNSPPPKRPAPPRRSSLSLKPSRYYVNIKTGNIVLMDSWFKYPDVVCCKLSNNKFENMQVYVMREAIEQEIQQYKRAKQSKMEAVVTIKFK